VRWRFPLLRDELARIGVCVSCTAACLSGHAVKTAGVRPPRAPFHKLTPPEGLASSEPL